MLSKSPTPSGFSLIEVVIAMAIFLIIALGTSFVMQTQAKSYKYLDLKMQMLELRHLVVANVDCQQSIREICDRGATELASANQAIGFAHSQYAGESAEHQFRWVLRPYCQDDTLFVDARYYNGDEPAVHPISKGPWNWQPVFKNGLCRRKEASGASCPYPKVVNTIDFATGEVGCR